MLQLVKVWNRKTTEHVEKYKDQVIKIKPGHFVEMEREEAVQFAAQYYRPKFDGNGVQLPESFKKIEIEGKYGTPRPVQIDPTHKCMACGHVCLSARELSVHTEENHADQIANDPEAEREIAANQTKTSFENEEELAVAVRGKPGRPRKEA